jgi:hypothetical protein
MKKTFIALTSLMLCMATFAAAQQHYSKKQTAVLEPVETTYHGCRIDQAKDSIGRNAEITGTVKSDTKKGALRIVKLGSNYTDKLFTVIFEGRAAKVIEDTNGKLGSAMGKIVMRNNEPVIVISQPALFLRSTKPKA